MIKIDSETKMIEINRGDKGAINFTSTNADGTPYEFQIGDVITFGVYVKSHLESSAVILKNITVDEATEEVVIELTSEDTKLGDIKSKYVDYWYEIQLNHEDTIIGYDDDGAKKFRVYPEGSDTK